MVSYKPRFTEKKIKPFLDSFGIFDYEKVKELPSYWDQNFYVLSKGKEYVLKITRYDNYDSLDMQNKAMRLLRKKGIRVQEVFSTQDGRDIIEDGDHRIRLVSFIPGVIIYNVEQTESLLRKVGEFVAQVDKGLQDFNHPKMKRFFDWDVKNSHKLREFISNVKDPKNKRMGVRVVDEFDKIRNRLSTTRKGASHNDGQMYNTIVNEDGTEVVGLIDFADMVETHYCCNLSVTLSQFMIAKKNPLNAAENIFKGYQAVFPLTDEEASLLPTLIRARLAMTGILGIDTLKDDPNNEYVKEITASAWKMLEYALNVPSEEFLQIFT